MEGKDGATGIGIKIQIFFICLLFFKDPNPVNNLRCFL